MNGPVGFSFGFLHNLVRFLMHIRDAQESEAAVLSSIAFESKAHWGYSQAQLAEWQEELTISPSTITSYPTCVAEHEGKIVGFFVLERIKPHWALDHLWVSPQAMGLGIGRALLLRAASVAAKAGATAIVIDADPNAEQFYVSCGAERVGSVPAPIEGSPSRERPQLLLATKQPNLALNTDNFHRPARQSCEVSQRRRPVKLAG